MKIDVSGGVVPSSFIMECISPILRDHMFLLKAYPDIIHAQYIGKTYGLLWKSKVKCFKDISNYREASFFSYWSDYDKRDAIRNEKDFMNKLMKLANSVDEIYITADDMSYLHDLVVRRNNEKLTGETHNPFFY